MSHKPILSIQGGGIRGIIPACALVELERQTGKLARDLFDFVGGTSTGALLTASIAAGLPAQAALDVYLKRGRQIFSPESPILRRIDLLAKGRQFDASVLHRVVTETLGPTAAAWKINDSPIDILITAASVLGDCIYFVRDHPPANSGRTGGCLLVDAAVASACATTYHDPWNIPEWGYCADGGTTGLADPVYQVCVEAFAGRACYGSIDPAEAVVISLGTGHYRPSLIPKPPGNLLERIAWVTSSLVGSSKTFAAETVERHWPGVLRVVDAAISADVDEAEVDRIPYLLQVGQEAAKLLDWSKLLAPRAVAVP